MEREYAEKMSYKNDDKKQVIRLNIRNPGYLYINFPLILWSWPNGVVQISCVLNSITY